MIVTILVTAAIVLIAKIAYDRGIVRGYSRGVNDARLYNAFRKRPKQVRVTSEDDIPHMTAETVKIVNRRRRIDE